MNQEDLVNRLLGGNFAEHYMFCKQNARAESMLYLVNSVQDAGSLVSEVTRMDSARIITRPE